MPRWSRMWWKIARAIRNKAGASSVDRSAVNQAVNSVPAKPPRIRIRGRRKMAGPKTVALVARNPAAAVRNNRSAAIAKGAMNAISPAALPVTAGASARAERPGKPPRVS